MRLWTVKPAGVQSLSVFYRLHLHHVASKVTTENKREKRVYRAYIPALNCLGPKAPPLYRRDGEHTLTGARERGQSRHWYLCQYFLDISWENIHLQAQILFHFSPSHRVLVLVDGTVAEGMFLEFSFLDTNSVPSTRVMVSRWVAVNGPDYNCVMTTHMPEVFFSQSQPLQSGLVILYSSKTSFTCNLKKVL